MSHKKNLCESAADVPGHLWSVSSGSFSIWLLSFLMNSKQIWITEQKPTTQIGMPGWLL